MYLRSFFLSYFISSQHTHGWTHGGVVDVIAAPLCRANFSCLFKRNS